MWTIEDSRKLELSFLKKHNYLENGIRSGVINWYRNEEKVSSISITVNSLDLNNAFIRLSYTNSKWDGSEKEKIDYKIKLDWDPVNFGGKRWFFVCPMNRDGKACHNRVRDIYQSGKYFMCRKCANLIYNSQTISNKYRGYPWSVFDLENYLEKKVKRLYYNGKPTKKYQTYLNRRGRFGESYRGSDDFGPDLD